MKKSLFPFVILFLILVFLMPRNSRFSYDYRKGSVWKYETLVAQFDFPVYKTQEQMGEEMERNGAEAVPYLKFSSETVNRNIKTAEGLSFGAHSSLKSASVAALRHISLQGILSDDGIKAERRTAAVLSDDVVLIQREKRVARLPSSEIYRLSDAKAKLMAVVSEQFPSVNVDSLFRETGMYDLVTPNLVFDQSMTDLVRNESVSQVSPTQGFVTSGQLIVSNGEIVTAEIAQLLDSYKKEFNASMGYSGPSFLLWLGNILLALAMLSALYLIILFSTPDTLGRMNELFYILLVVLLTSVAALTVGRGNVRFLCMVPFPLALLLLQPFFKKRIVVSIYMVSLLPLLLFAQEGAALYVMFVVTGLVYLLSSERFSNGFTLFVNAAIGFVVILLVFLGFRLTDTLNISIPLTILYLFIGQVLSVALSPLAYFFERVFRLVSDARLEDLSNTESRLLRELEEKAPGTFQHSLQVMSMADAAARSIGADVTLVRAGALYHDIGKMKNPQCFVENESILMEEGDHPYHSSLTPVQSATAIIAHVKDGMDMARRNGLPAVVSDFILTHHGTGTVSYFYNKYVNEGGDPADISMFRYPGHTPSTREQVIVMLCDSLEAASRTLNDNTPKAYSDLVEKIVSSKMSDGQLRDAAITIKELNTLKDALKSYLPQLYHERVAYPKLKNKQYNSNGSY